MNKRLLAFSVAALSLFAVAHARSVTVTITKTQYQHITGFGAACCDGAMRPFGTDTKPVELLYGKFSRVGLNIMRMEISPNFVGDNDASWSTYNWQGCVPSYLHLKKNGGIVFGTPWSPPGDYKTNGVAQGGKSDSQGNKRGELRKDCYEKFFPWLNTYLKYMKSKGVNVDAVSIQNEPDWWVDYSGCLYTPEQQLELVKNYAHMLDRETYKGVRLISAEPLGFDPRYSNMLLDDEVAREQIDIIAGHLYGHPPLNEMEESAKKAAEYGKEVWMTEHSVSDNIKGRLPNWHEQLLFAEEVNECMLAGGTAYIYWYMRAHWAFVGTGETQYGPDNIENKLLPRGLVMSHFSKYVTGSTRLKATTNNTNVPPAVDSGNEFPFETSAYIKGDSIIVIAIDTTGTSYDLKLKLPYYVKSGFEVLSTSNESLCKKTKFTYDESTRRVEFTMPPRSLATFVFTIDREATDMFMPESDEEELTSVRYYDLHGRPLDKPDGLCIQQNSDGTYRKIFINSQN